MGVYVLFVSLPDRGMDANCVLDLFAEVKNAKISIDVFDFQ